MIAIYGIGGKRAAKIWQFYFDVAAPDLKESILERWATTPIPSASLALVLLQKHTQDEELLEKVTAKHK